MEDQFPEPLDLCRATLSVKNGHLLNQRDCQESQVETLDSPRSFVKDVAALVQDYSPASLNVVYDHDPQPLHDLRVEDDVHYALLAASSRSGSIVRCAKEEVNFSICSVGYSNFI